MSAPEDFRDFDAETADTEQVPFAFKLGGRTLTAYRPIPGGPFLTLCRALAAGQWDAEMQVAWADFIDAVLADDDGPDPEDPSVQSSRARFGQAYAASNLDKEGLYTIGRHIIERGTARPTPPPSPSVPGSPATGEPPKVVSLSPAPDSASGT